MGLHMIELPDDLAEWIKGGMRGLAPLGLGSDGMPRTTGQLITAAIEKPMVCGTCRHSLETWMRNGAPMMRCDLFDGVGVHPTDFCSNWEAQP